MSTGIDRGSGAAGLVRRWHSTSRWVRWPVRALVVVVGSASGNELAGNGVVALVLLDIAFTPSRRTGVRPAERMGLTGPGWARSAMAGFALGAAELTVVVGVMWAAGWYRVERVVFDAGHLADGVVLFLFVALFEELIARGWLWMWIERFIGSIGALVVTSVVFGALHLANPNASLIAVIALGVSAGGDLGAGFLATRRLWFPIGVHWSWNLFEGTIYGTPVSGIDFPGLLRPRIEGPESWTGGAFGPEAGWPVVLVGAVVGAALLLVAIRRGHLVGRGGRQSWQSL